MTKIIKNYCIGAARFWRAQAIPPNRLCSYFGFVCVFCFPGKRRVYWSTTPHTKARGSAVTRQTGKGKRVGGPILHQGTLCQENRTSCHPANTESEKGIELGYSTGLGLDTELKNLSPNGYDQLFVSSPYYYLSPDTAFENKLISCIIFWYVQLELSIHVLGEVPRIPYPDTKVCWLAAACGATCFPNI